jgi:hypothetical protein
MANLNTSVIYQSIFSLENVGTAVNYRSIFITLAPWANPINFFTAVKPFQPSLMFLGKAGAYPCDAPFKCSTLGYAPGLTHKH